VATGDFVEGTLRMHREGYGFVHPTGGEQGNNVFIPAFDASRALDGDRVRVEVRGPEGRLEGRLVEVIGRRREQAVGIYMARGKRAWVEPQDARLGEVIQVPVTQIARPGDVVKVVLEVGGGLIDARQGLRGEVSGSLGRPGHPSAEVLSIVFAQGFNDEFPEEVMSEASACPSKVDARTARSGGRRDLRDLPLLTIDGADARDFDDAVYAAPHAKGYRLVVAIADVTHYVREDTALDAEALHRATSVYLPDRVLPMLPERLSNGICSLRPDEDRLCMVADLVLDRSGKRVSSELYPAVMRSVARCTYEEVQDVLDGKDVPHRNAFKPRFEQLNAVAGVLRAMRKKRGAIDFDLKETRIVVDDEGFPDHVELRERLGAHRLIEECMLAANEAVASTFRELELPTVYRFHGEPNEQKLGAFLELAAAHGFTITARDEVPSSVELNQLLEAVEGHAEQRVLNQLLLRSMMQAVYSSENVGHYGLAAENYLHFTSPIRRYPDLMVHRLLKEHWRRKGKARSLKLQDAEAARLEEISGHCSERERAAMQAEREVSQYYVCLMMQDRIGEVFEATVSSLTDFGFFAELTDVHVEGVVRSDALGPGVKLDLVHHVMTWPNGRKVRVGTPLTVRLVGINTQRRQLDLEVEAFTDDGPGAPSIEHGVGRATRGRSPTGASPDSRGAGGTRRPAPRGRGAAQEDAPSSRRSAQAKGTRAARPPEIAAPVAPPRAPGSDPGRPPRAEAKAPADAYGHRPAFVPPGMGEPLVPPRSEGSVHPGFDRLRALATQGRKDQTPERRSSGRGERGEGRKPGPGGRNRR